MFEHLVMRAAAAAAVALTCAVPIAHADNDDNTLVPNNKRLNDSVVSNVYTVQHQAGCKNDVKIDQRLQLAAQWQANDVLSDRTLDGDLGSDGSTPQSRAQAAGYQGEVAQTVAINPALAINSVDVINRWYYDPVALAIMSNCAYTQIGVWSANSLDRSVLVGVYGKPA